jgi:hypothetical protein
MGIDTARPGADLAPSRATALRRARLAIAALAAVVITAAFAATGAAASVSTSAAAHRVTVHSLMVAIVRGETMTIDGITYMAHPVPPVQAPVRRLPSCAAELAAYRQVSRQAGLRIGSQVTAPVDDAAPHVWAAELRRAGDVQLARAAAAVHDDRSGAAFVMALTASAAAALTASQGGGGADREPGRRPGGCVQLAGPQVAGTRPWPVAQPPSSSPSSTSRTTSCIRLLVVSKNCASTGSERCWARKLHM